MLLATTTEGDDMPINRDIRDLPEGNPPDAVARFGPRIAEAIYSQLIDEGPRSKAMPERWFRASLAGMCTRSIAAGLEEVPETDPPSLADEWRMWLGKVVHAAIDSVLDSVFPGAQHEIVVDLSSVIDGSAHLDLLIKLTDDEGKVVAVEVKTMNGFAFKLATTEWKRGNHPEGPKLSAVLQGSLAAAALDADELVVLVFSMENISKSVARSNNLPVHRLFTAEWTYSREQYLEVLEPERRRLTWLKNKIDELKAAGYTDARLVGQIPPVVLNDEGTPVWITNPSNGSGEIRKGGQVLDMVTVWNCDYCRYQTLCAEVGV